MNAIIGALRVVLGMDSAAFENGGRRARETLRDLSSDMQRTGANIRQAGMAITGALTLAVGAVSVGMVNVASDAAEMQSAFEQTFKESSKDVKDWAEVTGDAIGRATTDLQGAAMSFQQLFSQATTGDAAVKLSKDFALLSQDLSSFFNVAESDALQKLRSGLTGEAEPLRDFGIFLNEATVAAKGLQMGLAGTEKALTDQDKILARAQLIWEATSAAQGDATRTAGGFANQTRALQAEIKEQSQAIGEQLLPHALKLVEVVRGAINAYSSLSPEIQTTILALIGLAAAAGPVTIAIGGIVSAVGLAITGLGALAPVIAAVRTAWIAYMGAVVLLGPAQATASAAALALGAAINFALGPIGLAIAAVGLLAAAIHLENQRIAESKKPTAEFTTQTDSLKASTDAYATAALAAATATGTEKKSLEDVAAAAKEAAIQKRDGAVASLQAAQAALANAMAQKAEYDTKAKVFDTGRRNPMQAYSEAAAKNADLAANQALANINEASKAIDVATAAISNADKILNPPKAPKPPAAVTSVTNAANSAKVAADELTQSLGSLKDALATPDEAADKTFADRVAVLGKALAADKITYPEYVEFLRRAREELVSSTGLEKVKPLELGKIDLGELETAAQKVPAIVRPIRDAFIEIGEEVARSLGEAIAYGDDLGKTMERTFQRMLAAWVDGKIADIFDVMRSGGKSEGGSGGGIVEGIAKGIGDIFNIGENANGTKNWRGGLTLVGEGGPEVINAPAGSQIYNQSQLAGMLNSGGGSNYFDLRGSVTTQDLVDQMNAIGRAARRGAVSDSLKAMPGATAHRSRMGTTIR